MKLDRQATEMMRENLFYSDKRSTVKRDLNYKLHLFPKGQDVGRMREMAWENLFGSIFDYGTCQQCKLSTLDFDSAEMHHLKNHGARCTCISAVQFLCHDCHVKRHGRTTRFHEVKTPSTKTVSDQREEGYGI